MDSVDKLPIIQNTFQTNVPNYNYSGHTGNDKKPKTSKTKLEFRVGKAENMLWGLNTREKSKSISLNSSLFESALEQRALDDLKNISQVQNSTRDSFHEEIDKLISVREILSLQKRPQTKVAIDISPVKPIPVYTRIAIEKPVQRQRANEISLDFYKVKVPKVQSQQGRRLCTPSPKKQRELIQVPGLQSPMKETISALQTPRKSPIDSHRNSQKEIRFKIITNLIEEFKAHKRLASFERTKAVAETKSTANRTQSPVIYRGRSLFPTSASKTPGKLRKSSLINEFLIQPSLVGCRNRKRMKGILA